MNKVPLALKLPFLTRWSEKVGFDTGRSLAVVFVSDRADVESTAKSAQLSGVWPVLVLGETSTLVPFYDSFASAWKYDPDRLEAFGSLFCDHHHTDKVRC